MKRVLCLLAALLLAIALPAAAEEVTEEVAAGIAFRDGWDTGDNCRVFYEIFVGSFSDSDGDGVGDLRGIINRMDYLNDGDPASGKSLGVEGLWLTPIFTSPSYHKYDVTDYFEIDPAFGTMDDLRELVELCHARGVKIILDLPLNHTGDRCAWYRNFLNAHLMQNPASPWYDYYTWIGEDEAAPAGRHFMKAGRKMKVEANFSDSMPELNFDNEAVRERVLGIARFYLEMGVDGFRFDAAKYIYLGDTERSLAFWTWFNGELRAINPEVYLVAEVWDGDGITNQYAVTMNCFRFSTSQAEGLNAVTAKGGNVNAYARATQQYLDTLREINPEAMNIAFVSNHDMDRAAGYLPMASGRMATAASLYLLAPGSPFLYYGEEIGLRGSRGGSNTDANRRLKMLWGDGDTVQDPPGSDYEKPSDYSVKDLLAIPRSLPNHYKRLIMIRKANPEIARGQLTALEFTDSKAGGYLCIWNGSTVAVLHNTTGRTVTLDLSEATDLTFTRISGAACADNTVPQAEAAVLEGTVLTLAPQTSAVLRMD